MKGARTASVVCVALGMRKTREDGVSATWTTCLLGTNEVRLELGNVLRYEGMPYERANGCGLHHGLCTCHEVGPFSCRRKGTIHSWDRSVLLVHTAETPIAPHLNFCHQPAQARLIGLFQRHAKQVPNDLYDPSPSESVDTLAIPRSHASQAAEQGIQLEPSLPAEDFIYGWHLSGGKRKSTGLGKERPQSNRDMQLTSGQ